MVGSASKCSKIHAKLATCNLKAGKPVDLKACGSKCNNLLVDSLQCEASSRPQCAAAAKSLTLCHKGIMGQGLFEGRKDCEMELLALQTCVESAP